MRIQVDVKRSIEIGRLSAINLDFSQKVNTAYYYVLAALFIAVGIIFPTVFLIKSFKEESFSAAALFLFGLFYAIGFFTVYGLINENRLKKIKGRNLDANKLIMLAVLKAKYNTDLVYQGEMMLSYYKRASFWNFALRVVVLFNNDDVLINISRFNQIGIKSFFHPFFP